MNLHCSWLNMIWSCVLDTKIIRDDTTVSAWALRTGNVIYPVKWPFHLVFQCMHCLVDQPTTWLLMNTNHPVTVKTKNLDFWNIPLFSKETLPFELHIKIFLQHGLGLYLFLKIVLLLKMFTRQWCATSFTFLWQDANSVGIRCHVDVSISVLLRLERTSAVCPCVEWQISARTSKIMCCFES